jgi:predicted secreted hydrolase
MPNPKTRKLGILLLPAAFLLACAPAQTQNAQTQTAQAGSAQAELPRGEIQTTAVRQSAEDFQRDLAPHKGQMEWWYASSSLPDNGMALHWALFKVEVVGRTIFFSHVAVTDLKANTVKFVEVRGQEGAGVTFPPLVATQKENTLTQTADGFVLKTPDLDLTLKPLKPAVRHPASGTAQSGQLEYQSVTRMALSGKVKNLAGTTQDVNGLGWFDHQWGDQLPGQNAFWDWMGLQLSDGSELMLYRVRDAAGTVLQTYGTRIGEDGQPTALSGLKMEPVREWKSALGRSYILDWKLSASLAEGGKLNLMVTAPRSEQELVSSNTGVTYWEGPLKVSGTLGGRAVTASGMGEFLSALPRP